VTRYLIVPGWAGSGPEHWQSLWLAELPGATRVEMPDWLRPTRRAWVAALDDAVASSPEPAVLIAHSLGCLAVAHWAAGADRAVRAALLVAPADVERRGCPAALSDFAPVPCRPLGFASTVVASDDDPYVSLERAATFARMWGSGLVPIARGGHLNAASGLGAWPRGRAHLGELLARADRMSSVLHGDAVR
jgi:predicted alpha/beta hydrolase family esterase